MTRSGAKTRRTGRAPRCGGDCEPEPVPTDAGMRIAFSCPTHGVHTVIDPFENLR